MFKQTLISQLVDSLCFFLNVYVSAALGCASRGEKPRAGSANPSKTEDSSCGHTVFRTEIKSWSDYACPCLKLLVLKKMSILNYCNFHICRFTADILR